MTTGIGRCGYSCRRWHVIAGWRQSSGWYHGWRGDGGGPDIEGLGVCIETAFVGFDGEQYSIGLGGLVKIPGDAGIIGAVEGGTVEQDVPVGSDNGAAGGGGGTGEQDGLSQTGIVMGKGGLDEGVDEYLAVGGVCAPEAGEDDKGGLVGTGVGVGMGRIDLLR